MSLLTRLLLLPLCAGLFVWFSAAQTHTKVLSAETKTPGETMAALEPVVLPQALPPISATAYLVRDVETGEVLLAQNITTPLPIASVTKLFTAAAVLQTGTLDATTTVLDADVATEGEAGKLKAGGIYTYRELLFPLLLESSNDAAAVFERVTHNELLETMSAGYDDAAFADASGLSPENQVSAETLADMAIDVYESAPHVLDITRLPQAVGTETGWRNNNPFVEDEAYRGGKHGYTEAAGRTFAGFFSEELNGQSRTVAYVVLGSDDIRADVAALRAAVQGN